MLAHRKTLQLVPVAMILAAPPCGAPAATPRQPDFDGDGHADLLMVTLGEKVGTGEDAGAVHVVYGTAGGLDQAGNQFWSQNSPGIADTAETDDHFGWGIAWGDFNDDGYSDLAAGAPGEDDGAGAVNVIYGSASGLASPGNQVWRQGSGGITGVAEPDEGFGRALAAGDFNGDGYDDLAIGVPDQEVNGQNWAGAVHVIYGSALGLTAADSQYWTQDSDGMSGTEAEVLDWFGATLAAGDFNGDGRDDLAIGSPEQRFSPEIDGSGAVNVLYGSADGLSAAGNQYFQQGGDALAETPEHGDLFGSALAAGDFNGDGRDDLAVAAPGEDLGIMNSAGAVHVLYGAGPGLRTQGSQLWTQNSDGIADQAETLDLLGSNLAAGDFDNDGFADLVASVPGENINGKLQVGAIAVLYGSAQKLRKNGNQFFTQDSNGIAGSAAAQDNLGAGLQAADFNGDGRDDLGVGISNKTVANKAGAGAVLVLMGNGDIGLRPLGSRVWTQNSDGIADKAEAGDYLRCDN